MPLTLGYIQVPSTLPQNVDPQVRNFLAQLQIQLRGWAEDVTRDMNALLAGGAFPTVATDPSAPSDGQIWYNTTTHLFKGYKNGSVVVFNTTP
jgi:hypothetical protein